MKQIIVRCVICRAQKTLNASERTFNLTLKQVVGTLNHKMDCYKNTVKIETK